MLNDDCIIGERRLQNQAAYIVHCDPAVREQPLIANNMVDCVLALGSD